MSAEIAAVLLLIVLAVNLIVMLWLFRLDIYDRNQYRNQLFLIWLLPVVGAAVVYTVGKTTSSQEDGSSAGSVDADQDGHDWVDFPDLPDD